METAVFGENGLKGQDKSRLMALSASSVQLRLRFQSWKQTSYFPETILSYEEITFLLTKKLSNDASIEN